MTDERYVFIQDVKEKKGIARSAAHKKNGCKSTRCTLPSDYLTKKEREKMNGEVKTWKMNEFYTWQEFKQMPDDIQEAYLVSLVGKYKVGIGIIAKYVFKTAVSGVYTYLKDKPYHSRLITPKRSTKGHIDGLLNDLEGLTTKDSADIFIPSGMAPGYCSDGTKVEDIIKEAEEVNKKLRDGQIELDYGPVKKDDDGRIKLDYVPVEPKLTTTSGDAAIMIKPLPVPVERLNITMKGIDHKRVADILSWFDNEPVTVTLIIEEIPE